MFFFFCPSSICAIIQKAEPVQARGTWQEIHLPYFTVSKPPTSFSGPWCLGSEHDRPEDDNSAYILHLLKRGGGLRFGVVRIEEIRYFVTALRVVPSPCYARAKQTVDVESPERM